MNVGMRALRVWRAATRSVIRVDARGMASHASAGMVVDRYANSFANVVKKAVPAKDMDAMVAQIKQTSKMMEDARLVEALKNPTLPREVKVDVCKALANKAKLSSYVTNLMMLAAENGRAASLGSILDKSVMLLTGESVQGMEAIVTTAIVLTPHQKVMLQNKLQAELKQPCTIKSVIDPSILGGMTIQLGDQLLDRSVKREIQRLCALLQSAV